MVSRGRRRRASWLAGIAAVLAVTAAACASTPSATSGSSPSSGTPVNGGVATYYLGAGLNLAYIFPFVPVNQFSGGNLDPQEMMYRPLYVFGGEKLAPTVNYPLSPAKAPVYSDDGKKITITLKGWKWSDGETVNAADVIFWLHMMSAEFKNWAAAAPGGIPQNITSIKATGPLQVTLMLNRKYSSYWYTYNELSQITPMPEAWDVTKLGARAGSGGCEADSAADNWAKCKAVYSFLNAQAENTSTYVSSPLWSVVNGPWRLKVFNISGADEYVPNPKYSGSPKPRLAAVKFVAYTSDTTQYTALETGQVDVGIVPTEDLPPKPASQPLPATNPLGHNYRLATAYDWGSYYYVPNMANSTFGAVFKQLYFRQALQYAVDQRGISKAVFRGYAYPTTGAVPTQPANPWIPPVQKGAGPYPFSIAKATALLTSHGWSKVNGVMTCTDPAKCGPGIRKGLALNITYQYPTGIDGLTQESEVYKSDLSKVGINLNLVGQSFNTVYGDMVPGAKNWQMASYESWGYEPDYYPTGEEIFQTGAGSNNGSYSDPTMDRLINASTTSSKLSAFTQYATYAAKQLPVIYMPSIYNIRAVKSNLHGVVFNPIGAFVPEYWYFTK